MDVRRYRVRLRENWRWGTVQVAGREFTKAGVELQEAELTEEIRNSPLLEITRISGQDGSEEATEAARALADQEGLLLGGVVGTGAGGRILKRDVEAVLGEGITRIAGQDGSEEAGDG